MAAKTVQSEKASDSNLITALPFDLLLLLLHTDCSSMHLSSSFFFLFSPLFRLRGSGSRQTKRACTRVQIRHAKSALFSVFSFTVTKCNYVSCSTHTSIHSTWSKYFKTHFSFKKTTTTSFADLFANIWVKTEEKWSINHFWMYFWLCRHIHGSPLVEYYAL